MTPRTYQAGTMAEALAQVKRDLGRDAMILRTRSFRKGAWLGLFGGRAMWEVTARPTPAPPAGGGHYAPVVRREEQPAPDQADRRQPTRVPTPAPAAHASPEPPAAAAPQAPQTSALDRRVGQIHNMVHALLDLHKSSQRDDNLPEELRGLRNELLRQDVDEMVVEGILAELRLDGDEAGTLTDRPMLMARLEELLARRIATAPAGQNAQGNGGPRVYAFIGPTGVGKTTTIAKLAADFQVRRKLRVGLVTIDTYRIAAVDQLRTYADIIKVPLSVVLTAEELRSALASLADRDVVLIDTAGRSQHDQLKLEQLSEFLDAARPDEVHLVLSATSNRKCLVSTFMQFSSLGVNRIVLTKLDEAVTFGSLMSVSAATEAPLSFVTTGQDVPDHIAPADPRMLARCVLKGDLHAV